MFIRKVSVFLHTTYFMIETSENGKKSHHTKSTFVFFQTRKVNLKKSKELFFPTAQNSVHLKREEKSRNNKSR